MRSLSLSIALCSILVLPSPSAPAPAAPPDCADVAWRLVTPSEAGNTDVNATNRDVPHYVTAHPTTGATDLLRVFLPGTFGQPGGSTYLLKSIAECNRPTIGLSYNFIPFADAQRNQLCFDTFGADSDELVADCLQLQHSDGVFGSEPGKDGLPWPAVSVEDSVTGRLTSLLKYLDEHFPEEGWARFRDGTDPKWDRIMVSGHSQGAGHTGYLAQTTPLAGAVLLSGPQDECMQCAAGNANLWLAQPWQTRYVTAAKHLDESASDVIGVNWDLMVQTNTLGWPSEPTNVGVTALVPPPYGAAVSEAPFNPAYTGGRPYHVSMAGDGVTPMTTHDGEQVALYSLALWPALFADPPGANANTVV